MGIGVNVFAKPKPKLFSYGDMNQWITREIKESILIGGNTKNVYEIGPKHVIIGDKPYTNLGGSPWATSNVLARVTGVTKTNNCV
ncbi:MAG: PCMD domain-containing protein, partial [Bacteroidales bacterium]